MPQPFVLIDGYNLMHASGLARRTYGPGDLEVCRNRLLQQLSARLNEEACRRTTVVFDAFDSVGDDQRLQHLHGLTVIFAPAGTDADSELERLIAEHSAPGQLWIVSSDHRLHKAARRRKATAVDSEQFWDSLDADTTPRTAASSRHTRPPDTAAEAGSSGNADPPSAADSSPYFDADYLADLDSELNN